MGSLFKPVVTLLSSHSSPSPPTTSTVMAPPPRRGPRAGREAPPYPPPLPPNPNFQQMLQHLIARVAHIDRRLGQLFQVYHAVNSKLDAVLDANDVEYHTSDDDVSDPSLPSDNDGED